MIASEKGLYLVEEEKVHAKLYEDEVVWGICQIDEGNFIVGKFLIWARFKII